MRATGKKMQADVPSFSKIYYKETFAVDYLKACDDDYWAKHF